MAEARDWSIEIPVPDDYRRSNPGLSISKCSVTFPPDSAGQREVSRRFGFRFT